MRLEIKTVVVSSGKRGKTGKGHKDDGNAVYLNWCTHLPNIAEMYT